MTDTEKAEVLKRLEAFLSKSKGVRTLHIEKDRGGFAVTDNHHINTPKAPSLGEAILKFLDNAEPKR